MKPAPTLGAVILAAGGGARLGGVAKALLRRGEETFLARIVRTARSVGLAEAVVVVAPPYEDDVARAAAALDARVARNAEPSRGMASSVAVGFAAIAGCDVDAAWLWPVDHPDVDAGTLERLVGAIDGYVVAKPRFAGRHGHPPLVRRSCFAALAACGGVEGGARTVLARFAAATALVDVEDAAVVRDVDEP